MVGFLVANGRQGDFSTFFYETAQKFEMCSRYDP
jgi:hypothetical protein